jgi:hypothetical protein
VQLDPEYYSSENSHLWGLMSQFREWLTHKLQTSTASTPQWLSPTTSSPPLPLLADGHGSSPALHSTARCIEQRSSSPISLGSDDTSPIYPFIVSKTFPKRKRESMVKMELPASDDVIEITDDDSTCPKKVKAVPSIKITRQLRVSEIIRLTEIPSCWTVPALGSDIAYELDLTGDKREWKDKNGELMSMASIIKSQVRNIPICFHLTLIQ